ncbi:hypothetical protein DH2020_044998 [Rehmannia glutinosa]|uniref:Protein kinase domain-containing protein n=1 Tax=Rehmannia glutinosa TaxID=99300 RepID=A0ABR0UF94_REHGL
MASAGLGHGGAGSSRSANGFKVSSSSVDWLGREMLEMRLRDQVEPDDDRDSEPDIIDGVGAETGHVIRTTIGGRNGQSKQVVSYIAEHVVGTGSFGVVFQAKCRETGEIVAIKKVLQDKRYKNRELQIMQMLDHPNIVALKHSFFAKTEKEELYLNLVLEYVPETVNRMARQYSRMNQRMPLIYICRALAYIHNCIGICHRDIKPQNLLVNPHTHQLKLCDFGSAKVLVSLSETWVINDTLLLLMPLVHSSVVNIWYSGSKFEFAVIYPANEGFGNTYQRGDQMHESKLYRVQVSTDQAPSLAQGLPEAFTSRGSGPGMSVFPVLTKSKMHSFGSLYSPFFDELRDPNTRLPNGRPLPPLYNFKPQELSGIPPETIHRLIPEHARRQNLFMAFHS